MMADATLIFMSVWEIIGLILVCSAASYGFYAATQFTNDETFDDLDSQMQEGYPKPEPKDRMIFWFVRYYLAPIVGPFYSKPIYKCPACMGSLHSILPTYLYMSYMNFYWTDMLLVWPFVALATCGVNYCISVTWDKIQG